MQKHEINIVSERNAGFNDPWLMFWLNTLYIEFFFREKPLISIGDFICLGGGIGRHTSLRS